MKRKAKIVEVVHPRYQPTKAEMEEDMRINASPEKIAKAVMGRVEVRHIPRPKTRTK